MSLHKRRCFKLLAVVAIGGQNGFRSSQSSGSRCGYTINWHLKYKCVLGDLDLANWSKEWAGTRRQTQKLIAATYRSGANGREKWQHGTGTLRGPLVQLEE